MCGFTSQLASTSVVGQKRKPLRINLMMGRATPSLYGYPLRFNQDRIAPLIPEQALKPQRGSKS
jgi:hypothetical protein